MVGTYVRVIASACQQKIGFPTDIALHIVTEALQGLDYAHNLTTGDQRPLGIIHRDVSPSNILISFDGNCQTC